MRIAEQSPHTAPNLSMKKSKVSVSTAQWCLVWVRKIDELDPTVAFLLPALGMASSGLALRFLKELSCDSLGMEQRKKKHIQNLGGRSQGASWDLQKPFCGTTGASATCTPR